MCAHACTHLHATLHIHIHVSSVHTLPHPCARAHSATFMLTQAWSSDPVSPSLHPRVPCPEAHMCTTPGNIHIHPVPTSPSLALGPGDLGQAGGLEFLPGPSHFRAPAERPPGAPARPSPGRREGAVITRPRGLSPSARLSSRPRPTRAQTLITASRPVISRGRGRTRRPAGRAQRGGLGVRCGSAAATPPPPWQREWVRCPAPRKWGGLRAGACGGASCECPEVDLRPNPRPAGQAASRASRPRIAASPPPKAILSPLSPTTPSALAEEWVGGEA